MKTKHKYPAIFTYAEDGISIEFPDLPGCLTCADTEEEAIHMAKEVLKLWMQELEKDKYKIPQPSKREKTQLEKNQKIIQIEI